MVRCPYCGTENYIGGKYCKNCFGLLREISKRDLKQSLRSPHQQLTEKEARRSLVHRESLLLH